MDQNPDYRSHDNETFTSGLDADDLLFGGDVVWRLARPNRTFFDSRAATQRHGAGGYHLAGRTPRQNGKDVHRRHADAPGTGRILSPGYRLPAGVIHEWRAGDGPGSNYRALVAMGESE